MQTAGQVTDVMHAVDSPKPDRILRGGEDFHEVVDPTRLLRRPAGNEKASEQLAKCWIVAPPADAHQRRDCFELLPLLLGASSEQSSASECAQEDQSTASVRVKGCVAHSQGAALRHGEERKPLQSGGIHDGLEILEPEVAGELGHGPVRQTAAALVVSNEGVVAPQLPQPWTPHGTLPVE